MFNRQDAKFAKEDLMVKNTGENKQCFRGFFGVLAVI